MTAPDRTDRGRVGAQHAAPAIAAPTIAAPTATICRSRRSTLIGGATAGSAALLAACGLGATQQPAKPKEVTGTLTTWMPAPTVSFREGTGGEVMEQFKKAYPTLTVDNVDEGNGDKLKTTVAAGTPPDFFHTQSYWQTTWGLTGIVQPLDNYVKSAQNVKPSDGWKFKWDELIFKGKTYAVPYSIDNRIIYMHKDLYTRAGLDVTKPPKTWDAMDDAVRRTYKSTGPGQVSVIGFDPFFGSGGNQRWLVPYWQLGGEFNNPEGDKITLNNPKAIQALEWCLNLIKVQGGWDAVRALETSVTADYRLFINGGVANFYATLATKATGFNKEAPQLELPVTDYPLPKNGKPATYAGGWAMCIPTGAKNPDASFQLMDFLYKSDIDLKWAQGYLRVPARASVGKSIDFTRNDPFLKTTVEAMPYGRFVASIPGGEGILPIMNTAIVDIMSGKKPIPDALKEAENLCQQEVDKFKR